jgi:ferric-dicitrate binding protein FerR (iron transport regulator)
MTVRKALDFIFKPKNKLEISELNSSEHLNFYKVVKSYSNYKKSLYSEHQLLSDFEIIERKLNERKKRRLLFKVVALFVLSLFSSISYFLLRDEIKFDIYSNNKIQISTVELKDGSKIHLSKNSKLFVPKGFYASDRWVKLEGQAFCDIAHNAKSRFFVKTENLNITVYGTRFNVRDFKHENHASTNLIEGTIKLELPSLNKQMDVYPSEKYCFNKMQKTIKYQKIPENAYLSYVKNSLRFSDTNLEDVLKTIGIYYNKDIILNSKNIEQTKITCVFRDKSVDYVLKSIQKIVDYEIDYKQDTIIVREK